MKVENILQEQKTTLVRSSCGLANVKNHPGAELLRPRKSKKPPWCGTPAGSQMLKTTLVPSSAPSQEQKTTLVRNSCALARAKTHPGAELLRPRKSKNPPRCRALAPSQEQKTTPVPSSNILQEQKKSEQMQPLGVAFASLNGVFSW